MMVPSLWYCDVCKMHFPKPLKDGDCPGCAYLREAEAKLVARYS